VKNIPWRLYASPVSRMLLDDKNLIRRALSLSRGLCSSSMMMMMMMMMKALFRSFLLPSLSLIPGETECNYIL
jgi:hypothetical protein